MLLDENFCETCTPKLTIKDVYEIKGGIGVGFFGGVSDRIFEFISNFPMPPELLHCTYLPVAIANAVKINFSALNPEGISCEYNPFITDHYAPEIIHFDIRIGHYPYSIRLIPKDEFA